MCTHSDEQPKGVVNTNVPNSSGGGLSGGSIGGYPYVYPNVCPTCNRCPTCGNYKLPYYPSYQPFVTTYNYGGVGQGQ